jgi:spermidine synthase
MDSRRRSLFLHDTFLILIMAVLAACGLIYEYLLSHYAGRVLGAVETAIYSMIGLMIVSMGIGAFAARWIKDPFTGFVWLEVLIALLGASSILVIAIAIALSQDLPRLITEHFNLTEPLAINGPFFIWLNGLTQNAPYIIGFVLGCMIGMEIPLIARIREQIHGAHLENNAGTIYGADYVGAGAGAALWVTVMLTMHIAHAAVLTASLNLIAGAVFLYRYGKHIKGKALLWILHGLMVVLVFAIYVSGKDWLSDLNNVLYKDKVVYRTQTHYQNITLTQRKIGQKREIFYDLYLNGRLQFSAADEKIYHSMLVYPAMAASARHQNILIIGGGDGLALRDVLRWNPDKVTLIDLDKQLVNLFADGRFIQSGSNPEQQEIMSILSQLNQHAFADPRVKVIFGDAFIEVNQLLDNQEGFDTIIVDLPDPSHPDLNKLYSDYFYHRLLQLLHGDGAMVVQSTSPYHAKNAFISIGKTIKAAGFPFVEQYHQNVPSFGEWGWSIATKRGASAKTRLMRLEALPFDDWFITHGLMIGAFEFPAYYWLGSEKIEINQIGTNRAYQYHYQAWNQDEEALF